MMQTLSLNKIHLEIVSAKSQPICSDPMLTLIHYHKQNQVYQNDRFSSSPPVWTLQHQWALLLWFKTYISKSDETAICLNYITAYLEFKRRDAISSNLHLFPLVSVMSTWSSVVKLKKKWSWSCLMQKKEIIIISTTKFNAMVLSKHIP